MIQDLELNKKPETHIKRYLGLNDRIDITEDFYTNLFIKIYAHHPEEIKLNLDDVRIPSITLLLYLNLLIYKI